MTLALWLRSRPSDLLRRSHDRARAVRSASHLLRRQSFGLPIYGRPGVSLRRVPTEFEGRGLLVRHLAVFQPLWEREVWWRGEGDFVEDLKLGRVRGLPRKLDSGGPLL